MGVPDFQSVMLPLLRLASDGQEHALRDSIDALANKFSLTKAERKEPEFFERLVLDVLLKMGYGGSRKEAGQAVGRGGDGIIKEDRLGLDLFTRRLYHPGGTFDPRAVHRHSRRTRRPSVGALAARGVESGPSGHGSGRRGAAVE